MCERRYKFKVPELTIIGSGSDEESAAIDAHYRLSAFVNNLCLGNGREVVNIIINGEQEPIGIGTAELISDYCIDNFGK